MKKDFKILCIDGGGMKGVYSASVLEQIEEKYSAQICDYFDLICGTSTGGLIALALSRAKSAREISQFYADNGEDIFPSTNLAGRIANFLKQSVWGGKYDSVALKRQIEAFLGADTKMIDSSTLLCIPSFNLTQGQPIVFKYPHKEGSLTRDGDLKMVDVAMATSAAPTYFPIVELDYPSLKGLFIDGGVWSNNPTLCGIREALRYFVGEDKAFSTFSILSISSVNPSNGWKMGANKNRSFMGWGPKLIQTPLEGQNHFADFFTETLVETIHPKGHYLRIPSPSNLSSQQTKIVDLDNASSNSIKTLQSLGLHQGLKYVTQAEYKSKLDHFFKDKKSYIL